MPTTFFGWVAFIWNKYSSLFIKGTMMTLYVALISTIIGFVIGLVVAVIRTIPINKKDSIIKKVVLTLVNIVLTIYVEVFRATPMIVQSMLIYYGSLQYFGIDMAPSFAAIFIVSVNTGAYMAEIIRGGIISIDTGQSEGAHSIGMNHAQTMSLVILPQAIRNIMPSISNEFVINIKDSAVLNVISVAELFFMTKSAAGTYFRYFESFVIACIIYFIVNFVITRILLLIEKKMEGSDTYVIRGSQNMSADDINRVNSNFRKGGL